MAQESPEVYPGGIPEATLQSVQGQHQEEQTRCMYIHEEESREAMRPPQLGSEEEEIKKRKNLTLEETGEESKANKTKDL